VISEYEECTVAVSANGFYLEDICAAQKANRLPDDDGNLPMQPKTGDDPCGPPPVPPTPPAPGPEVEICVQAEDCGGNFTLVTPSTVSGTNPVAITEMSHIGKLPLPRLRIPGPLSGPGEATAYIEKYTNPLYAADGLQIGIKGLAEYRRRMHA
jgi:hypothetical protein